MSELFRFAPLPTIKELLRLYNLRAMRQLSQNFLLDMKITDKIASIPETLKDFEVCEIGPGPGGITRSILKKNPKKVIAVEKDVRFKPILEALQSTARGKLQVVYSDILYYDFSDTFDPSLKKDWEDDPPKIHIMGNLPFHISDALIFQFLKDISLRRNAWSFGRVALTLTFQDEVARRITSDILMKTRTGISFMCQNWCKVQHKYFIHGRSFLPKPEVNVGVVHFEPLVQPIVDLDFHFIEKIIRTIFNCRQKYFFNTVKRLFPVELRSTLVPELLDLAKLRPHVRPYQISNEELRDLCVAYKYICDRDPRLYNYNYRGNIKTREEKWKEEEVVENIIS